MQLEPLEHRYVLTSVGLLPDGTLLVEDLDNEANTVSISTDSTGQIFVEDSSVAFLDIDTASGVTRDPENRSRAIVRGSLVSSFDVNLGGNDDNLSIDFRAGDPLQGRDFAYEGGGQTSQRGDSLSLTGGTFDTVEHQFANANDGNVVLNDGQQTITYTGLEPVDDDLIATNRIFTFLSASDENIQLSDDGDINDNESFIDSTEGEEVEFVNPTGSLIIQTGMMGGAGVDAVSVQGLDSQFSANLIVNAEGDDALTFNLNDTNTNGGSITGTAGAVQVAGVTVSTVQGLITAGDINLTGIVVDLTPGAELRANDGAANPGDVNLLATFVANGEADDVDPFDILALSSPTVLINTARVDGDNVNITADATADVSFSAETTINDSVSLAGIIATSNASVVINGSTLNSEMQMNIRSDANTVSDLTRVPEDDEDANDDDKQEDAAIATSVVTSNANVSVANSQVNAGTVLNVIADNVVNATTIVDGLAGDSSAGGVVTTNVVTGGTNVNVTDSNLTALGLVTLSSTSERNQLTTAIATTEGATDDGDNGTTTEGQQTLDDNDASTSDGDMTLAAAVAVATMTGDTVTTVSGSTITSSVADIQILSSATHNVATLGDGSSTSGSEDTGVGVAFSNSTVTADSLTRIEQGNSFTANNVGINSGVAGAVITNAVAGPAGDANGADVTVAGSLAIAVDNSDAMTTLEPGSSLDANGANVTIGATQLTSSAVTAVPTEGVMGESTGVGASVAVNVTDHTTRAEIMDGATLTDAGNLTVASNASNDVDTSATSAAAGGTGIAAVVALTINNEDAIARIGTGGDLNASGDVTVSTIHLGDAATTAEGDAEGSDSAAIGVAIGLDFTDAETTATTSRNITAGGNVLVTSASDTTSMVDGMASAAGTSEDGGGDPDTNTQASDQREYGDQVAADGGARDTSDSESNPSASSSEGDVSVAAAVTVNIVESVARAAIETGEVVAGGSVLVSSQKSSNAQSNADGSATGGESAGVGAAVAINRNNVTNEAIVGGSADVNANGLSVLTGMTPGSPQHESQATSMAGAGDTEVGIAGSVSINLVDIQTDAVIESGADVNLNGGDLAVTNASMLNNLSTAAPVEDGGMGSDVGVGASFAMNRVRNDARAEVANNADVTGDVANAQIINEVDITTTTDSQNGASGDTGIGAAVGLSIVDNNSLARIGTGAGMMVGGEVEVRSDHDHTNTMTAGAEASGESTGVGATVAVNDVAENNDATIARNIDAGGDVSVLSNANVFSTIDATASAGGQESGEQGADDEADQQRNNNPNNGGNEALPSAQGSTDSANSETTSESSTGSSGVGVAAVVGVNVVNVTNEARIQSGADVEADGAIAVEAAAHVDAITMATGTAVSLNEDDNIGAAVSVNRPNITNRADVGANSTLTGDGLSLQAYTPANETNDFFSWAAAAGGGTGDIGIAGSVGVNVIDMLTEATSAGSSQLRSTDEMSVGGYTNLNVQTLAAGGGFSQGTSVGAAVAVTTIDADTLATIDGDADATGSMTVTASTNMVPTQMDMPLLNDSQDPFMTTLAVAGGISTGDVGVAGAVVVNIFNMNTRSTISSSSEINQDPQIPSSGGQDVNVIATDTTETISMTGALGVAFGSAGIAAGLDLGVINKDTRATIGDDAVVAAGGDVLVSANSTEDMTTLSTNLGVGDTVGVAGSASIYIVNTDTQATVGESSLVETGGGVSVISNGDYEIVSVAGALAFGSSAGIGAANVTLTHTDNVLAEIGDNANVSAGDDIVVDARSSEDLIGTTAAGGAASTAAVAASATVVVMNETTHARIGRSANISADNGAAAGMPNVEVNADDTTNIVSVSGSLAAAGSAAVGVGADVATINKDTRALIDSNTTADVEGDMLVTSDSLEDITAVAAGVAASGGVSVIVDAAVHVLDITTMAYVGDDPNDGVPSAGAGDIFVNGSIVIAADERTEMDNIVGVAAGGLYSANATAAGVAVVDKQTQAFIGDGTQVRADGNTPGLNVRTGDFDITYQNESLGSPGIETESDVSIDSDSGTLSAQGEVGLAEVDDVDADQQGGNDATDESLTGQRVANLATQADFHGIAISATNRDDIETYTVSVGGAIAGVAVSAGVNVIDVNTNAFIGNNADVNASTNGADAAQSVQVGAGNDFYHQAIAGSVAAGIAGVAPSAGITVLKNDASATIGDGASVNARNDVAVRAHQMEDMLLVGFGIGGGVAAVAGNVEVGRIQNSTLAGIGSATVNASGDVLVLATDDTDSDIISGAVAGGVVGVGASVGVMSVEKDTNATIDSGAIVDADGVGAGIDGVLNGNKIGDGDDFGTLTASGVIVQAESSESFLHFVIAATGGFVGVAGAVGVTLFDSDTSATIGNDAQINQTDGNAGADASQDVYVNAANDLRGFSFAGGITGGFVGVGGAVDVGIVRNDTLADVGDNAIISARDDVEINALGIKDLDGFTFSSAGGFAALSAAVSVWSIGEELEKDYTDNDGNTANATDGGESQTADENATSEAEANRNETSMALNSYDDDAGNPNNSNSKQVGSITGMAANRIDADSPSASDFDSIINAAGGPSGTTASVAGSAIINAGDDIAVNANEDLEFNPVIGGLTTGAVGVGGSVSVVNTSANTAALANGTFNSASGDLSVSSILDEDVDVTSLSGEGGFVAVGAAVVVVNDTSDIQSSLGSVENADQVTVLADADQVLDVTTGRVQAAAAATGASFTRLNTSGDVNAIVNSNAQIGQAGTVNDLDVTADSRHITRAETNAFSGGAIAVSANFAIVEAAPNIEASIGNSADISVNDSIDVTADAEMDVESDVLTATGGAAAIGASIATATMDADVESLVRSNAVLDANNDITVSAYKNHDGTDPTAGRGALAIAESPAVSGLMSGSGTIATANETSLVRSRVGGGANLSAGNAGNDNVVVQSFSSEDAQARGLSLSLSLGTGVGGTIVNANLDGTIESQLNGSASGGGSLRVEADATTHAEAEGDAASTGLTLGATGASTNANVTPTINAGIGNGADPLTVDMNDNVTVRADHEGDADAESFGLSVGAAAIGVILSEATMSPDMNMTIADFAEVNAGQAIIVETRHNQNNQLTTANADAGGGGIVAGTGVDVDATAAADLNTVVQPRAILDAGTSITLGSQATNRVDARGDALTGGGLISVGAVLADGVASGSTNVEMDGVARSGSGLTIEANAREDSNVYTEAVNGGGLGAFAASTATSIVGNPGSGSDGITATVGNNATVDAGGTVNVRAISTGDATAEAEGVSVGGAAAFGVGASVATIDSQVNAEIGDQAGIDASNVNVIARHNTDASGDATGGNAIATSWAAAGSVGITVNVVAAPAAASADVEARIGENANIDATGGNVVVDASSSNRATSVPQSISLGGIGSVGVTLSEATTNGTTIAEFGGNIFGGGGTAGANDLVVEAADESLATAATAAASVGFVGSAQATSATANVDPTVRANLTGAADARLTDDFIITADSVTNADADAAGFSASGGINLGGSLADANLTPQVHAYVGNGAELQANGSLVVEANHNSGLMENGATADASASGGGVLSSSGAFATADVILDIDAHVNGDVIIRNDIFVTADSDNMAAADAGGTTVAGAGIGVSESSANIAGNQIAYLGDIDAEAGQRIRVNNVANNDADAVTQSLSGGILGNASLNFAIANVDPNVRTSIEDGASIAGGDQVRVRGQVTGSANAATGGASVAGGATVGTSQADAILDSTVNSYIGSAEVTAGEVIVRAYHNTGEGGSTGDVAFAEAHTSGLAGVAAVSAADATSTSTADVSATLGGNGATISGGELVEVLAASLNDADAVADGLAFGGLGGVGVITTTTTASGDTTATVDNNTSITGGEVTVRAEAGDFATSESEAAAGGIGIAADASAATTNTNPDVLADIQSGVVINVTGDVAINSRSFTEGDANASGVSLSGLGSGGASRSTVNSLADVDTDIDPDAMITTEGSIQVRARHNDKVNIYDGTFNTGDVSVANDTISTPANHGLSTGDRVTYRDLDETPIGGLNNGQSYEAIVVDNDTVRLGQTFLGPDVSPVSDTITFNNSHGFETGQRLFYGNTLNIPVSGLSLGQDYYVFVIDEFTIKLYETQLEALAPGEDFQADSDVDSGDNEITLPGHNFAQDQAVTYVAPDSQAFAGGAVESSGADDNIITFGAGSGGSGGGGLFDHGFFNGDRVTYRADTVSVDGLTDGADYYVLRLDANQLQLATDPGDLAGSIVDINSPDQNPEDNSLHFLSDFQEVPLNGLEDGQTYYVDLVLGDPNAIRLLDEPGGSVVPINNTDIEGTHSIRAAGLEINAIDAGQNFLYVDLTSQGTGNQRLLGAGGAAGLIGGGGNDGVFSSGTSGSAGSLFGSFRFVRSDFNVNADVSTNVDDGATLEAMGDIDIVSSSFLNAAGVARVAAGALIGIGSADVNTNFLNNVNTRVGQSTQLTALGDINVDSLSDHDASTNTRAIGGGGIAAANAHSRVDIVHGTEVDIDDQSQMTADGGISVRARSLFGGDLVNDADSGGFAIRPDAEADYNVETPGGDRLDTRVDIGSNAVIFAKRDTAITAEVDNAGRIDARSYANAYGLLADTNADANIRIRSNAVILVAPGAEITGRDSLDVTSIHRPLSVFTLADADGKALSDSDARVVFVADTGSLVTGLPSATLTSHDVDVSSLIGENSFGFSWSYFGAWPVSSGEDVYNWTTDQEILFDSDVVLLPGPQPELVIDSSGTVVTARNVTVDGGNGEGYVVPGDYVFVDDIINNDPGRANFETNDLGGSRPGVIEAFSAVPGLGTLTVQHTFDEVTIFNESNANLVINDILPIDRDGQPPAEVNISTVALDYEFNINHSFQPTLIDIHNTQPANTPIPSIFLLGEIDNPIGTTNITNEAGSINHFSPTFDFDYILRSNIVNLNASQDAGGVGEFMGQTFILPLRIDLVQSEGRPEDLIAIAGQDVAIDLRGVLRETGVANFEVNSSYVSAGRNVTINALKAIEELDLENVGDYYVTVDTDLYIADPDPEDYVRYFQPDVAGDAILIAPVLGVFGGNAQEIESTYVFDLIEYSDFLFLDASGGADCTSLDVTIVDTTPGGGGGGGVDWLASGDITANIPNGDAGITRLISQFGDVTVNAFGDIFDFDGQPSVDIAGNNITLNSQTGGIGRRGNDLEIDTAFSGPGGINGSAVGGIYLTELAGPLRIGDLTSGIDVIRINAIDGLLGDFDRDGDLDLVDVDRLVSQIVSSRFNQLFDTNSDGVVDQADLNDWVLNLKKTLLGDANLDFVVDVTDFNRWNANKFTFRSSWSNGDFNADGVVDVSDFAIWNSNKFTAASDVARPNPSRSPQVDANQISTSRPRDESTWPTLVERIFADE